MPAGSQPFDLPIVDHHAHLRPGPSGLDAARRFARAGGTHLFLTTQNYLDHPPTTLDDYREQFATTLAIAQGVRADTGLEIYCVLAPFPVDLVNAAPSIGLEAAETLQRQALRLAADLVLDDQAVALGEVGRAHFPVDPPIAEALDRVLVAALETARDVGCPAVLHTEDLEAEGYRDIALHARNVGFSLDRLVKHYARTYRPPAERVGIIPSFLAKREVLLDALADPGPWFLETDFLDDPSRPGTVLPLETIPRRVRWLAQQKLDLSGSGGEGWDSRLAIPFVSSPKKVYGLDLERKGRLDLTAPWSETPPPSSHASTPGGP